MIEQEHPWKMMLNSEGEEVYYMKFGSYWFPIGIDRDSVDHQYGRMRG